MYKILLATDGSEHSLRAAKEVLKIAGPLQAEVTALSVVQETPVYAGYDVPASPWITMEMTDGLEDAAKKILGDVETLFKEENFQLKTSVGKGHPADVICKFAEDGNFDLIVMGSRGLGGIKQLIMGSVSSSVVHCSQVPVMIVK